MSISKTVLISRFDYFFVFILVIYAGSSTSFTRSLTDWNNIYGLAFVLGCSLYLTIEKRINFSRNFIYLISGFLLYFILLTIKFKEIHPRFLATYLIYFFISYITVRAFKARFFVMFMNVIYILCFPAILFWFLMQIIPSQTGELIKKLSLDTGTTNYSSSIIFYTINSNIFTEVSSLKIGGLVILRNSGFAWEPGVFSILINLSIFNNLIINKFRLKRNKKLFVLVFTLITTFSTTGYAIFILLIMFYVYNQDLTNKLLLVPIGILVVVYITTLSFMTAKVIEVSKQDIDQLVENSILYNVSYAPQRFTSLQIDFQDFRNNPILGYGGHQAERWTNKLGADITTISGLGKLLAKFGLVGVLFFLVSVYKSSKFLSDAIGFRGWGFLFLIFMFISISYSIIEWPLFMCFWLFPFFLPRKRVLRYYDRLL